MLPFGHELSLKYKATNVFAGRRLNWIWHLSVKAYIQLLIGLEEKIREYLPDLQLGLESLNTAPSK